jgi:uncharacterized protein VirK/YbjX
MTNNRTVTKQNKKKWDPFKKRRKWLLFSQQVTYAQIGEEIGRSHETIKTVINLYPEKKSRRIQEYIAERFGVPYEYLWGSSNHHRASLPKGKKVVND